MPRKSKDEAVIPKKKSEMRNWYETELVHEFLEDETPYPFEATQIKVNSRILCCGTTGSGKTMALLEYCYLSPKTFARVIVVHKEQEPLYEAFNKGFNNSVTFYTDLAKLPPLTKIRDGLEKEDRILLVIDDYVCELANKKKYPNLNDYFIYGRKKKVTVFLLCQSYFECPLIIRQQCTYLLLFEMPTIDDTNMILRKYAGNLIDKEELRKLYLDTIDGSGHNFFKIQCTKCPPEKKFSRNFTDFYDISALKPSAKKTRQRAVRYDDDDDDDDEYA